MPRRRYIEPESLSTLKESADDPDRSRDRSKIPATLSPLEDQILRIAAQQLLVNPQEPGVYGYMLAQIIKDKTHKRNVIYRVARRLIRWGYIEAKWEEGFDPEIARRPIRKFLVISEAGLQRIS